jgi:hypothetical protein
MIIAVLGIIDVIVGIILAFGGMPVFQGNGIVFAFAILIILKGIWSWINNLTAGFKLDFMGVLDIVTGIFLLFISAGFFLFFFVYFGVMEIIKGVYSFAIGVLK